MRANEKFDPAPIDKHADKKREPGERKKHEEELDSALEHSFPASDPVSAVQPKKPKHAETK